MLILYTKTGTVMAVVNHAQVMYWIYRLDSGVDRKWGVRTLYTDWCILFFQDRLRLRRLYCCLQGFTLLHCCVNLRLFLITFNLETLVHLLNFNEIDTIDLCMKLFFFVICMMLQLNSYCYLFAFTVFRTLHHII